MEKVEKYFQINYYQDDDDENDENDERRNIRGRKKRKDKNGKINESTITMTSFAP